MEFGSLSLQLLVQGIGYELMLFASVGILLFGLDDLLLDLLWLARRFRRRPPAPLLYHRPALAGRIAVFVPAWDEADVLPAMLHRTLAAWKGEDFRLYIGCYPNDAATLFAIAPLVARDPRLRLVVTAHDGPTTKGDNLNGLWAAMGADERGETMRFCAVVLHDAEDHVHPEELALYRRLLTDHAMVQIPVVPFIARRALWVGGHYGDEFAEAHGKDLPLRSDLGLPIPSAGVGCALSRDAMTLLALERGGQPFRANSLTEDYEMGLIAGALGLRSCFADMTGARGDRIVSRGLFPGDVSAAVRQKSRWIAGIALAGWAHIGWPRGAHEPDERTPMRALLCRWMLWRDRRAPLAALVVLAAYVAFLLTGLDWVAQHLFGWPAPEGLETLGSLLAVDAGLLLWRIGMRSQFSARCYGWRQAIAALPRAFVANIIAILAARRAIMIYYQMLRSGAVVWDKTRHVDIDTLPQAAPEAVRAR